MRFPWTCLTVIAKLHMSPCSICGTLMSVALAAGVTLASVHSVDW